MTGQRCEMCLPQHYGFSTEGCKACECDPTGSLNLQCDLLTGQCECRDKVRCHIFGFWSRSVVLNRWVATLFWVVGTYFWVAKTCVIVLLYLCLGRQIVHYYVLWVANYQTLRTTGLDLQKDILNRFKIKTLGFLPLLSLDLTRNTTAKLKSKWIEL